MKRARKLFIFGATALVVIVIAAAAWAYWATQGTGSAVASVATLDAPTNVVASSTIGSGTVHVTWTGVTAPDGGAVDGYYVQRFAGVSLDGAACGSSASSLLPATPTACDDASVAAGTYTYTVTAVFHSWTATSGASSPVTVVPDATPPDAPVIISPQTSGANSGTFSNGVFNASTWGSGCTTPATICGTASDNVGGSGVQKTQLEIVGTSGANNGKYWNGSAWASGSPQFFDAAGTTSWSYQLAIPADGGYDLVARTIDNVNLQSSNTSESITVDTAAPSPAAPGASAAITFGSSPLFVKNENVNLTDGASDTGSGVRSVSYSYCAGASGSCTSGTPIGSTSTAAGNWPVTWSTPLPADGPYRIVAVATDNAGNVSDPSPATLLTVDTTPPTVSRPTVNGHS